MNRNLGVCILAVALGPALMIRPSSGAEGDRSAPVSDKRKDAQQWVDRGLALNDNSTSEALCYRRAIEIDPDYAAAHFNLAFLLQTRDELEEALAEYQAVMRLDPTRAEAFLNASALILRVRRNAQETRVCLNRFVELAEGGAKRNSAILKEARVTVAVLEREIHDFKMPDFKEFYSAEEIVAILTRPITRGGQTIYQARRVPLLLFATGSASLSGRSASRQMKELGAALSDRRLAGRRFAIEGHADSRGDSEMNRGLSRRRARAVFDWLAAHGVGKGRLEAQFFGEDAPAYPNDSEQNQRYNRRAEIVALP